MHNEEQGQSRLPLFISILTLVAILITAGVSVRACKCAEEAEQHAKASAEAAERSAEAAEDSVDLQVRQLEANLGQYYYLSKTPSYIDSDDKDDVWFLTPGTAVPIRLPPEEVMEEWESHKEGWYFVWLSIENEGLGIVENLSVSLYSWIQIKYIPDDTIKLTIIEPYYENSVRFDQPLRPGQRAILLVSTMRGFPSEMPKLQVYILVNHALQTEIQGSISYGDLSSDKLKTLPLGVSSGEVRYYVPGLELEYQ